MKKICKYLLLIITVFSLFSLDANAITFKKKTSGNIRKLKINDNLGFSINGSGKNTLIKYYKYDGSNTWKFAFCTNRGLDFYSGSNYKEDSKYQSAKCKYMIKKDGNWKLKKGGDCSKIVGYIINKAYSYAGGSFPNNYGYAQTAIWVYLGKFSYGYDTSNEVNSSYYLRKENNNVEKGWTNNSHIKKILRSAWTAYYNDFGNPNDNEDDITTPTTTRNNNLYNVKLLKNDGSVKQNLSNNNTLKMNFKPDQIDGECGELSGNYITQKIKITNTSGKKLTINLKTTNTNIKIFDNSNTDRGTNWNPQLNSGASEIIYLKSSKYFDAQEMLEIYAEIKETEESQTNTSTFDSRRWTYKPDPNMNYSQGLLVLVKSSRTTNIENNKTEYKEFDLKLDPDEMTFETIENNGTIEDTGKCANESENINEIKTTLDNYGCMSIPITNGSVRILVGQKVEFQYGNLFSTKSLKKTPIEPNVTVYAGGSFEMNTDTNLGKITYYKAGLKWKFADYKNNVPYYYNSSNPESSKADTNEIIGKINDYLLSQIETGVTLPIYSYDSNEVQNNPNLKNVYETLTPAGIKIEPEPLNDQFKDGDSLKFKSIGNNTYELQVIDSDIQVRQYTIDVKGKVTYDGSGSDPHGYFVPMHYDDATFPYNIGKDENDKIDLSLIKLSATDQGLRYNAVCNIEVKNQFDNPGNPPEDPTPGEGGLRYRPISVENPFPKGISKAGVNWQEWYPNNVSRISESYNKVLAQINLDRNTIQSIKGISHLYQDWTGIGDTGESQTVNNLFGGPVGNYCEIGRYSPSCNTKP